MKPEWLERVLANCIPKSQLVDGAYYWGRCRNAYVARWSAEHNQFYHWREKFSYVYIEPINHPEDFNGFDFFSPHELVEPPITIPFDRRAEVDPVQWKEFMAWERAKADAALRRDQTKA